MHCVWHTDAMAPKRLYSGHHHISLSVSVVVSSCENIDKATRNIANEVEIPVCIANGLLEAEQRLECRVLAEIKGVQPFALSRHFQCNFGTKDAQRPDTFVFEAKNVLVLNAIPPVRESGWQHSRLGDRDAASLIEGGAGRGFEIDGHHSSFGSCRLRGIQLCLIAQKTYRIENARHAAMVALRCWAGPMLDQSVVLNKPAESASLQVRAQR
ncbi:hypothetical protein D3C87_355650 [compost metagenome]